ncbi:MAG: ParA family protein [Alphaproteobacteria bacterium]|nr:ParA family protein [Alphaproteobacteria bacterium]
MKTLVMANQKGGVGKTATVFGLATDFRARGLRVVVIDVDTQGNVSFTFDANKSGILASSLFASTEQTFELTDDFTLIEADEALTDLNKISIEEAYRAFSASIRRIEEMGYDVCLIDTAPSLGVGLISVLLSADYVISPIELEVYSIKGIEKMLTIITHIREANSKLKFLGMLPNKVDHRNPRHERHYEELKKAYPDLLIPCCIGLRSSVSEALASGVPVWDNPKTSARVAAKEFRDLADYVYQKMELAA